MQISPYTTLNIDPDPSGDLQVHLTIAFDNESADRASAVRFLRSQLDLVLNHLES